MKVTDPSGQVWRVHRRWLPWNPQAKKAKFDGTDALDNAFDGVNDPAGALIALPLTIVTALLAPIVLLVLLSGIEFILLAIVLPFSIIGRMFFGKRWWVQVRRGRRLESEELAGTWGESGTRVRHIAKEITLQTPQPSVTAASGLASGPASGPSPDPRT